MARDRKTAGPASVARSLPFVLFSFHGFWRCALCTCVLYLFRLFFTGKRNSKCKKVVYGDGKFVRSAPTYAVFQLFVLLYFSFLLFSVCHAWLCCVDNSW
ncbi:hypothetical protein QYE76_034919 [Lolium multiflorum]|uniref:Transmembrane protein n=1 Tax=Lolium multiflorum TaxID=4521 RepID=A0AAD8QZW3_LOLMU|nr:hypothetical protein QYE76_034919 [Lolium multiflorum]